MVASVKSDCFIWDDGDSQRRGKGDGLRGDGDSSPVTVTVTAVPVTMKAVTAEAVGGYGGGQLARTVLNIICKPFHGSGHITQ